MFGLLRNAIALLLAVLLIGIAGCGDNRDAPAVLLESDEAISTTNPLVGQLAEVSPPERIQQLKPFLDVYEPQVRITFPKSGDILTDTTVSVKLRVQDFPTYKDPDLGLGPHLHLFLDDQPYQAVYDTEHPIVFTDLAPGTHTLRVFASRPWHESFKNEGAYDQVIFNVFTESPQNNPDPSRILLTYSRPQGSYGTEPIMLDFYLKNAPLHLIAEEDAAIADWRIRCTVNGESFVFDRWQPIYLEGFQPGKNWVKLEVIDENGSLIDNAFNTGVRLVEYTPGGEDGLSKLVRGEISLAQAKVLVDPEYVPPVSVTEPAAETTPPEETQEELQEAQEAPEQTPEEPKETQEKVETTSEPPSSGLSEPESESESAAEDSDVSAEESLETTPSETGTEAAEAEETIPETPVTEAEEPVEPSIPATEAENLPPESSAADIETSESAESASGDEASKTKDEMGQPESAAKNSNETDFPIPDTEEENAAISEENPSATADSDTSVPEAEVTKDSRLPKNEDAAQQESAEFEKKPQDSNLSTTQELPASSIPLEETKESPEIPIFPEAGKPESQSEKLESESSAPETSSEDLTQSPIGTDDRELLETPAPSDNNAKAE